MSLTEVSVWVMLGLISGSVPWSIILTNLVSGKDARNVGDGNPGATNAWIVAGWRVGLCSLILDVGKAAVPVWVGLKYLSNPATSIEHVFITVVAISPVIGHGWSPILKFRGGKALASSWGSWIALTQGLAFPVAVVFLGVFHLLQKNHAITVTLTVGGLMIVSGFLYREQYILMFGVVDLLVVLLKHRQEYLKGFLVREWLRKVGGSHS